MWNENHFPSIFLWWYFQDIVELVSEQTGSSNVELAIVVKPAENLDSTSELSDIAEEEELEAEAEKEAGPDKLRPNEGEEPKITPLHLGNTPPPLHRVEGPDEVGHMSSVPCEKMRPSFDLVRPYCVT